LVRFKGSRVQRFKGSEVQGFRVQGFRVQGSGFRGLIHHEDSYNNILYLRGIDIVNE